MQMEQPLNIQSRGNWENKKEKSQEEHCVCMCVYLHCSCN